jgi:hypothetical protein
MPSRPAAVATFGNLRLGYRPSPLLLAYKARARILAHPFPSPVHPCISLRRTRAAAGGSCRRAIPGRASSSPSVVCPYLSLPSSPSRVSSPEHLLYQGICSRRRTEPHSRTAAARVPPAGVDLRHHYLTVPVLFTISITTR